MKRHLLRLVLPRMCCLLVLSQAANSENERGVNNLTETAVIGALQSSGFQAQHADLARGPTAAWQIMTGVSGVKVLLTGFLCTSPGEGICGVLFMALFKDVPTLTKESLMTLTQSGMAQVIQDPGKDGKAPGIRVQYIYPCEGLTDAHFVPMVLKQFGDTVAGVMAAYRRLGVATEIRVAPTLGQDFPKTRDFYPEKARRHRQQGEANVNACVDSTGKLSGEPSIAQSSGNEMLDAAALALAKAGSGHYVPASVNGVPTSGCLVFKVNFELTR